MIYRVAVVLLIVMLGVGAALGLRQHQAQTTKPRIHIPARDSNQQWGARTVTPGAIWLGATYQGYQAKTGETAIAEKIRAQTPGSTTPPAGGVIYVDRTGKPQVAITPTVAVKGTFRQFKNGIYFQQASTTQGVIRYKGQSYSLAVMPPLKIIDVVRDLTINN
jgi:hypothetical protein